VEHLSADCQSCGGAPRYRVIRPFRRALAGVVSEVEIEALVENISGAGLRLNAAGGARVVMSDAGADLRSSRGQ
jgi:hypothetical protein